MQKHSCIEYYPGTWVLATLRGPRRQVTHCAPVGHGAQKMQVREPIGRSLLHFLSGGRERRGTPQKKAVDAKCAYRQCARQKALFFFLFQNLGQLLLLA